MNKTIQNVRIVDAQKDFYGNVIIEGSQIKSIEKISDNAPSNTPILMPGWFDPHVHFRDPGFTHKEDFHTGTRAAVSAGVTSIFDMPNTSPATFTTEILDQKRQIAQTKAVANYGLYFGAGVGNLDQIAATTNIPGTKLYLNTTTGNLKMDDENSWRGIFNIGKKVSLHAEGETFFRAVDIWVEENFPCEIHLCHASLKSEIQKIEEIREKFPEQAHRITVEVTPHHLFLTDKERLKHGAFCCMKPQLATQDDQDYLWKRIIDGTIDLIATDHAPHTKEEKEKAKNPELTGPFGVPGVETYLPKIMTAFLEKDLDLKHLVRLTSYNTHKIFHITDLKGAIKEGYDADLILVDPNVNSTIDPAKFFSKSKWSPFAGNKNSVQILKTIIAGKTIFENGKFVDESFRGQEINFK